MGSLLYFKRLDPGHRKKFIESANFVTLQPQQKVFREGEEGSTFFVILKGKVSLKMNMHADVPIDVGTPTDGEVIGEISEFEV
jgi:CRP-like cAMP-binding protein